MGWTFFVFIIAALFAWPKLITRVVTPLSMNLMMLSLLALTAGYGVVRLYRSGMSRRGNDN
jgi:hypothetical protein